MAGTIVLGPEFCVYFEFNPFKLPYSAMLNLVDNFVFLLDVFSGRMPL